MKLSIVIPAYNEEKQIGAMLSSYLPYFINKYGEEVEFIVVVNGSTDSTDVVVAAYRDEYQQLSMLVEPENIGKGGAIIEGIENSCGDWVGFADADGATPAAEFFRLYKVAQNYDGVIASRWTKGATVMIPQKKARIVSSRLFNILVRVILGLKYKDTQCGAKIFKASVWKSILPDVDTAFFAFDVDVLFQLKRKGFLIREEPTVWNDVGGSTVQLWKSSFNMFCSVIRIRLKYSPFRFMVQVYDRIFHKNRCR